MNSKELKRLIKLADELDRGGHTRLAEQVDQIIAKATGPWQATVKRAMEESNYEEIEVEIPIEEKEMLDEVLLSLKRSLE
jgi:hypothetical protein